ncbi:MAG: hypothetical protein ACLPYS_16205, partial [Vulcanimicrobiaceae bacterium]
MLSRQRFSTGADAPNQGVPQATFKDLKTTTQTLQPFKDLTEAAKKPKVVSVPAVNDAAKSLKDYSDFATPLRRSTSMSFQRVPNVVSDSLQLRQMSTTKEDSGNDWDKVGSLINGKPGKVTMSDIRELARDPEKLNGLFEKIANGSEEKGSVYNSPPMLFPSDGHAYVVFKKIKLKPEELEKLENAGPLNGQILKAFPNGSKVLEHGKSADRVQLGVKSEIIVSEKGSYQAGDGKRVDKHLASTTSEHPLDGDALHAARIDKTRGEVTILIAGAGRSKVPGVDRQNNLGAEKLWHTVGEIAVASALDPDKYQDSLSAATKKNYEDLNWTDRRLSSKVMSVRQAFGPTTAETVESMEKDSADAKRSRESQPTNSLKKALASTGLGASTSASKS